jgi:hypothetical protein
MHLLPRLKRSTSLYVGFAFHIECVVDILQLARKYHPDTNTDKGARDKFVEIQEAYDVRRKYMCLMDGTQDQTYRF